DSRRAQHLVERQEGSVAVMDEKGWLTGVLADQQEEISSLLLHPAGFWMRSATGELHSARAQMDEEQRVIGDQPGTGPDFLGEEISRPGNLQMRLNKLLPGQSIPMWTRWN